MPVIRVEMLPGRTREQKQEIADVFTREFVRIAHCPVEHVQVLFTEIDRQNWATGGVLGDQN